MKQAFLWCAAVFLVAVAVLLAHGPVEAQSSQQGGNGVMVMLNVGTPGACAWPTGATFTNGMALCATSQGLYYALNGQLPFNPVAPPASSQAPPTSVVCTNASISGSGLTASSCTLK